MNVTDKRFPICLRKRIFVQMEEHGLTPAALETQLKNFREGFSLSSRDAGRFVRRRYSGAGCCRDRAGGGPLRPCEGVFAGGEIRARFGRRDPYVQGFVRGFVREAPYGCSRGVAGQPPPLRLLARRGRSSVTMPTSADGRKYRRRRAPLRGNPEGTGVVPPLWG